MPWTGPCGRPQSAAGDILSALDGDGPAQDMDDYEKGAEAVAAFMDLMVERAETLDGFHAVSDVSALLTRDAGWEARAERGWTPRLWERPQQSTCSAPAARHRAHPSTRWE